MNNNRKLLVHYGGKIFGIENLKRINFIKYSLEFKVAIKITNINYDTKYKTIEKNFIFCLCVKIHKKRSFYFMNNMLKPVFDFLEPLILVAYHHL